MDVTNHLKLKSFGGVVLIPVMNVLIKEQSIIFVRDMVGRKVLIVILVN